MNKTYISQARSMLTSHLFRPSPKPKTDRRRDVLEAKQVIFQPGPALLRPWVLLFGLIWLLIGCGSQTERDVPPAVLVVEPTSLPAQPTSAPTAAPVATDPPATPTLAPTAPATPTPAATDSPAATLPATASALPTVEIDSEAETFYYKGLTYAYAGLPEEAMTNFNQAIALQPDYVLAHLERGKLYMQQGQLDQARSDYHYALELTTDPAIKAEVQNLLQQLTTQVIPAVTATPPADQTTPTPQVTAVIVSGPPVEAQVGQPFAISLGQTARLKEANLTITFLSVLEDSRCPTQVECFWSGQARIMIQVQQDEAKATTFELNSLPQAKQDTITSADYQIQLSQIDPYPKDPSQPIPPEAYQATFVITAK